MDEVARLILVLVKRDFPEMSDEQLAAISPHQRRGYLGQVTRFLKCAELFGYTYSLENLALIEQAGRASINESVQAATRGFKELDGGQFVTLEDLELRLDLNEGKGKLYRRIE